MEQAQCGKLAFWLGNRAHFRYLRAFLGCYGTPFYAINSSKEPLFGGVNTSKGMCNSTSKPLEKLSLFLQCENAEHDPFWSKEVYGFPVRTPICHIVPIFRVYGGGHKNRDVGSFKVPPPPMKMPSGQNRGEWRYTTSPRITAKQCLSSDAAFLLTVGSFLLTVELFYLQLTISAFLLTIGAFHLQL